MIASFSGLTGSMYVWQPEISAFLNSDLLEIQQKEEFDKSWLLNTVKSLIEERGGEISQIHLPYREQQTISIDYKDGKTEYFHPYSGTYLGEKSNSIKFFEKLLIYHRTLGIADYGKYIIGTSALIFVFLLLMSGLKIWWDIYGKKVSNGFKLKCNSPKRLFNYDLHKVLGIFFILPLGFMAFSGAYFTFNSSYKEVMQVFDLPKKVNQNYVDHSLTSYHSIGEYLAHYDETYFIRAIYFPVDGNGKYKIRLIERREIQTGLRKTKEMELHQNGSVLTLSDFPNDPLSLQMAGQFYPIHIGEIGGIVGRFLVFISGFIPLVLLVSGWKIHKSKNREWIFH
ncbi:PepSY domain-containing protein [Algoriphagus sp. YJ13C]|uniref:PepSY domain-containing protein n=1 Tax=Algoriphagus pacificus TaxID=2811234 RepID=A0ABS3CIE4_9BACT|nr:PepSY domain-containing protein [Algoriphagus pacificus]